MDMDNTFVLTLLPPLQSIYGTGKKKCLSYLVGNLVATNWPIEKALHAIGYNQFQLNSPSS